MSIDYHNPELPSQPVHLPFGFGPLPAKNSRVFLFDIDNCLYGRLTRIHDMMQVKIHEYFKSHLALSDADANELHTNYYKTYGLALEGLVRNHAVDALEYNSKVDDALDLKLVLPPDTALRAHLALLRLLGRYDYFWLVTNAYKNHALRVVSFLGLGDLFDGLTYCDYATLPIVCKPMTPFFLGTLRAVNVDNTPAALANVSFVDDSELNVKAAHRLGFGRVFHFVELDEEYEALTRKPDYKEYYGEGKIRIIRSMLELE